MNTFRSLANRHFGHLHLWLPLAAAFFFVSLSRIDDGGTNSMARYATMRAMADEQTFRIDNYFDWTQDWARTPDGHYYSNKAPGPTLIAFPVFFAVDRLLYNSQLQHPDEKGRRQAPRGIHKVAISTLFQVIPFLLLTLACLHTILPAATSRSSYYIAMAAILFGNTAGALMSSYLGNPFSGMAMMGVALFYLRGKLGWMSFFFGWVLLADYASAVLVIPFAFLLWHETRQRGFSTVAKLVLSGAAIPAFLWCWYHTVCFGSPLSLPFKYEVQALVGTVEKDPAGLWGKTSFLPRPAWLFELLFGTSRGILFTQPWLLLCLALPFVAKDPEPRLRRFFYFSTASFLLLLWVNAGFPGWHGGGSPGPRYLAAILPVFGLFLPLLFRDGKPALKGMIIATVFVSLGLRALIYATWILPPPEPIWPYYLGAIQSKKEFFLLGLFAVALALATWAQFKLPANAEK